jgi:hypothetical protein
MGELAVMGSVNGTVTSMGRLAPAAPGVQTAPRPPSASVTISKQYPPSASVAK